MKVWAGGGGWWLEPLARGVWGAAGFRVFWRWCAGVFVGGDMVMRRVAKGSLPQGFFRAIMSPQHQHSTEAPQQ